MRQENNEDRMKVYLIGAGPGDPGLLTIKGKDILEKADVVVYDYLANDTLLGYARPDAERIYVGKVAGNHALPQDGINKLIIEKAKEGCTAFHIACFSVAKHAVNQQSKHKQRGKHAEQRLCIHKLIHENYIKQAEQICNDMCAL